MYNIVIGGNCRQGISIYESSILLSAITRSSFSIGFWMNRSLSIATDGHVESAQMSSFVSTSIKNFKIALVVFSGPYNTWVRSEFAEFALDEGNDDVPVT